MKSLEHCGCSHVGVTHYQNESPDCVHATAKTENIEQLLLENISDRELRIMVATAQGWENYDYGDGGCLNGWLAPGGKFRKSWWRTYYEEEELPNYHNDLNVCHRDLISKLSEDELKQLCSTIIKFNKTDYLTGDFSFVLSIILRSTPRQICVAWLIIKKLLTKDNLFKIQPT